MGNNNPPADNCIWGSDWPFLNIEPKPDYRQALACLERWLPDEDQRRKVLWETACPVVRL